MFYVIFIVRHFFVGLLSLDVVFFNPLAVYVLMDVAFALGSFNS